MRRTKPGESLPWRRKHASASQVADALWRILIKNGRKRFHHSEADGWLRNELPNYERPEKGRAMQLLRKMGVLKCHRGGTKHAHWEYFPNAKF